MLSLERAGRHSHPKSNIVVASVQTLGRGASERIRKFSPSDFDVVIIDEAHHSVAATYKNVIEHFGLEERQGGMSSRHVGSATCKSPKLLIGFTATPNRGDGKALGGVFDEIVFWYSILDAIEEGWLVDLKGYRVTTDVNLDRVSLRAGDFAIGELENAINVAGRNELVVKSWFEKAEDRQTIVFCVDIAHAQAIAQAFRVKGVSCEAVWGSDPNRKRKLQRHRAGDLRLLTNVGILTEGYDDWQVACVVMARPTQSSLLYIQMIGRSTRIPEGTGNLLEALRRHEKVAKKDSIIIDVVDNTKKHHLMTGETLFGFDGDWRKGELLSVVMKSRSERTSGKKTTQPVDAGSSFEILIERVELLKRRKGLVQGLNRLALDCFVYYLSSSALALIERDFKGQYGITPYLKQTRFSVEDRFESREAAAAAARCWYLAMAGVWLEEFDGGAESLGPISWGFRDKDDFICDVYKTNNKSRPWSASVTGFAAGYPRLKISTRSLKQSRGSVESWLLEHPELWIPRRKRITCGQLAHLVLVKGKEFPLSFGDLRWQEAVHMISSELSRRHFAPSSRYTDGTLRLITTRRETDNREEIRLKKRILYILYEGRLQTLSDKLKVMLQRKATERDAKSVRTRMFLVSYAKTQS